MKNVWNNCSVFVFKNKNFDFKDAIHPERPVEFDEKRLNQLLYEDPRQTTR